MDGTSFTVGRVPGFGNCALTILMVHGCKPSCSISCKTIDSLRCGEYVPIFCCGWPCSDRGVSSVLPKGPKKTEAVISTASPSTLQTSLMAEGFSEALMSCPRRDRKSTRLNSSHRYNSYAVLCFEKKKKVLHTSSVTPSLSLTTVY